MKADVDPDRIARARNGDAAAFDALVESRIEPMTRTAMAILGREDMARDAVQDALLTAWRELASLRDPAAFGTWLTRILVNRCRRLGRGVSARRLREIPLEALDPADEPMGPDPGSSSRPALERAFERLSIEERSILVLHHLEDRPLAEIAGALEIPVGTAKSRLFAARRALERALERETDR